MAIDPTQIAPGTIGLSVYNLLAMLPHAVSAQTVAARLRVQHFEELEFSDVVGPIGYMFDRGWIEILDDDRISVRDPQSRVIKSRAADDVTAGDNGILQGGWSGWIATCPKCKPMFLEDIIKELP